MLSSRGLDTISENSGVSNPTVKGVAWSLSGVAVVDCGRCIAWPGTDLEDCAIEAGRSLFVAASSVCFVAFDTGALPDDWASWNSPVDELLAVTMEVWLLETVAIVLRWDSWISPCSGRTLELLLEGVAQLVEVGTAHRWAVQLRLLQSHMTTNQQVGEANREPRGYAAFTPGSPNICFAQRTRTSVSIPDVESIFTVETFWLSH